MNEYVFCLHFLIVASGAFTAGRYGKETLTTFVALVFIFANLFVLKQIKLFGLYVTASDAFVIGGVLALNMLNERFGKATAQKALWIAFGSSLFFVLLTRIHIAYWPSEYDRSQSHFLHIFRCTPRIVGASLASFLLSQRFEITFYKWLQSLFGGRYLIARNYISISLSQLLDTLIFAFLGLYGIVGNLGHIIFVSYVVKLVAMLGMVPLAWAHKTGIHKKA